MDPHTIKVEVEKNLQKLETLRDEVKVKLHLATLDAKQEWDEKLAPKVVDIQHSAKEITESSRSALSEVVARLEDFLSRLKDGVTKNDHTVS